MLQHATQKWLEICSFGSLQIIAGAKGLVIFFLFNKGNLQQLVTVEVSAQVCAKNLPVLKGYCEYRIKVFLFCNRVNLLQTSKMVNEMQECIMLLVNFGSLHLLAR